MAQALACPNCGRENPAEARFCGNCGTALTFVAPRISVFPAALALFIGGLLVGGMWRTLCQCYGSGNPTTEVNTTDLTFEVLFMAGAAAGQWLGPAYLRSGRRPSVLGMTLIGGSLVGTAAVTLFSGPRLLSVIEAGILGVMLGLGVSLMLPRAFWHGLRYISTGGKIVLAIAVVLGPYLGFFISND